MAGDQQARPRDITGREGGGVGKREGDRIPNTQPLSLRESREGGPAVTEPSDKSIWWEHVHNLLTPYDAPMVHPENR